MQVSAIILAAGQGTRMKSAIPKVMHEIAGRPLIWHILNVLAKLAVKDVTIICSKELSDNTSFDRLASKFNFIKFIQEERLGTGHALKLILEKRRFANPILVINGDCPLVSEASLAESIDKFNKLNPSILNIGFEAKEPTGYGRLITSDHKLLEIVEQKDATQEQLKINKCNFGSYIFSHSHIKEIVDSITNKNNAKEYYLTDAIKIANSRGLDVLFELIPPEEAYGINDKIQLAQAEKILQKRLRRDALLNGVTMISPKTVFLSPETVFGRDVVIEANVIIKGKCTIDNNVVIKANSYIEDAIIGANSIVGPFARLRPNTVIGQKCKIGNFVEIKASTLEDGVKASHLTYIGDAHIGKDTNIGAGTVFCNYDGYKKHKTKIGTNAFIGSNSSLIAPLEIGSNVIIGAGSVVTKNAENSDLVLARVPQINLPNGAKTIASRKSK